MAILEVNNLKNKIESLQNELAAKNDQIRRYEQGNQYSRNYSSYRSPYSLDVASISSSPYRNKAISID